MSFEMLILRNQIAIMEALYIALGWRGDLLKRIAETEQRLLEHEYRPEVVEMDPPEGFR